MLRRKPFREPTGITELTLPEGLEAIDDRAFGHNGITHLTVPTSVTELSGNAFARADQLTEIVFRDDHPAYASRNGMVFSREGNRLIFLPGLPGEVRVPDGATEIGTAAFQQMPNVSRVIIPSSVAGMGTDVFRGWRGADRRLR